MYAGADCRADVYLRGRHLVHDSGFYSNRTCVCEDNFDNPHSPY